MPGYLLARCLYLCLDALVFDSLFDSNYRENRRQRRQRRTEKLKRFEHNLKRKFLNNTPKNRYFWLLLTEAVQACCAALQIYTREQFSMRWAALHSQIAFILFLTSTLLEDQTRKHILLREALQSAQYALLIFALEMSAPMHSKLQLLSQAIQESLQSENCLPENE